jgi:DNA polymerase III subunit epsilon
VAHSADLDIAFNVELKRAAKPTIEAERVIDTLMLARASIPADSTLDGLCSRYGVT